MKRNKKVLLVTLVAFQLIASGFVRAEEKEYPEKAVQIIVGYVPGSILDLGARAFSKVAPKYLGKPVVVVNMPGAASTVACNELAKSTPDGHTLAVVSTGYPSMTIHQQKVPFDPKTIIPVLGFEELRELLFVRADSPFTTFEELVAYGRKNPGAIKYAHAGKGLAPHLMGILLFRSANIKATDVPYRGSAELVPAVIGGHIVSGITDVSGVKEHVQGGTLRVLATFTNKRLKEWPEVPTPQEKGYADVSPLNPLLCLYIHKDTPANRVKKLHDLMKKTVEDPEFVKILDSIGQKSEYVSSETVKEVVLKAENLGVPLLKELGLFVK